MLGVAAAHAAEPASLRGVAAACQAEAARFCTVPAKAPDGAGPGPQIDDRDAIICLRPYRISVSLSCRRALNSAGGAASG